MKTEGNKITTLRKGKLVTKTATWRNGNAHNKHGQKIAKGMERRWRSWLDRIKDARCNEVSNILS